FTACCARGEYRVSASAAHGDSAARRSKYGSTGRSVQSTEMGRRHAKPKAASRANNPVNFSARPLFCHSRDVDSRDRETSGYHQPSQVIAEYFGRLAGTYGDGVYYGNRRQAVLETIAPEFANARELLDVGCGNGAYLTKFVGAPGNRTVTGADLSFEMLLSARNRAGAKCRLLRADAARLPFKPESFDFIFASHVLQFVADVEGVVAEFARCMQAGGVLIATWQRDDSVRKTISAIVGPERWARISRGDFSVGGAAR